MHQVIADGDLADAALGAEGARDLLSEMLRARRFDERALALQRRGWMSGYPSFRGQEGSQVGAARAMDDDDWLVPTYRSNAMQFARGVPMSDVLLFRRGRAEYRSGHGPATFPQSVPIATQIPHATGLGMARDHLDGDEAVVCYLGDGATSEGDFHEGLNVAGVFEAPVVFFCENNHWAISLPEGRQTASATIARKAEAYGFDGVRVDGNDPLAVYETVADALETARDGEPVLVESLTYRQGAHSTSDDPSRYEDRRGDLPGWRTADPVERFTGFLREAGVVDDDWLAAAREAADEAVEAAVERAESVEPADPDDVFEHVYGEVPPRLGEQRTWLREFLEDHAIDGVGH